MEKALFTALISNQADLLCGLIIIEGIQAIQTGQSQEVTEELLKSYFSFAFEEKFVRELKKNGVCTNSDRMLGQEEISRLLKGDF